MYEKKTETPNAEWLWQKDEQRAHSKNEQWVKRGEFCLKWITNTFALWRRNPNGFRNHC